MGDETRFEEIDAEIKLKLAELREYVQGDGGASLSARKKAQQCLKDVDAQIQAMEDLINDIPTSQRPKYARIIQAHKTEKTTLSKELGFTTDASKSLDGQDRDRLLSSTARLESSSRRLENSRRIASDTETVGSETLTKLKAQREQLENSRAELDKAEGYVDKSLKTLKEMGRRYMYAVGFADFRWF